MKVVITNISFIDYQLPIAEVHYTLIGNNAELQGYVTLPIDSKIVDDCKDRIESYLKEHFIIKGSDLYATWKSPTNKDTTPKY